MMWIYDCTFGNEKLQYSIIVKYCIGIFKTGRINEVYTTYKKVVVVNLWGVKSSVKLIIVFYFIKEKGRFETKEFHF